MTLRETKWRRRLGRRLEKLRYHSLERSSFLRFDQGQGKQSTGGAESSFAALIGDLFSLLYADGVIPSAMPRI